MIYGAKWSKSSHQKRNLTKKNSLHKLDIRINNINNPMAFQNGISKKDLKHINMPHNKKFSPDLECIITPHRKEDIKITITKDDNDISPENDENKGIFEREWKV